MTGKRSTGRQGLSGYDKSDDAAWEGRTRRAATHGTGRGTGEGLRVIYGPGCWCGERNGHDWPGKAEGAPHPRDWPGQVNGRGFR